MTDCELEMQALIKSGRPPTEVNFKPGGDKGRIITGVIEPLIELERHYYSKNNWN